MPAKRVEIGGIKHEDVNRIARRGVVERAGSTPLGPKQV